MEVGNGGRGIKYGYGVKVDQSWQIRVDPFRPFHDSIPLIDIFYRGHS